MSAGSGFMDDLLMMLGLGVMRAWLSQVTVKQDTRHACCMGELQRIDCMVFALMLCGCLPGVSQLREANAKYQVLT